MNDEEYNRIFAAENTSAARWTLFLVALVFVLITASFALAEEECVLNCNETAYRLELNGQMLEDDMTLEDCVDMNIQIEPQTPPFAQLLCVEYPVSRQRI